MTQAILLVGGQGTRMRPLTLTTPKPLLPVAGVPFLAHQFARLRDAGVTRVVLATSYRADMFTEVFGDGSAFGLEIVSYTEVEPLGTGGAIRNAAAGLTSAPDEPVLIFNGDILSGHDLSGQIKTHESTGAAVTLHLVHVADPRAFGCVPTTPDGRVTAFLEKLPEPITDQINGGCYVFTRSVIDQIPAGRTVSVERETFPGLLAAQVRIQGFLDDAYWLDLGSPAAYVTGSADLVTGVMWTSAVPAPGPAPFLALAGALLHPQAHACDGSVLGVGTSVAVGAHVERSVLGDRVSVGAGARLLRCAVGADVVIGEGSQLIDCAIGDGVQVPAGAHWEQVRAPESA